ncbi:MAG: hypothetical protein HDS26_06105 [Bacteroides sp.]|nr:hypothetical protein [Bacteroides sp.]MBD5307271.1 hypothetical protein [Bacteroides sp.]
MDNAMMGTIFEIIIRKSKEMTNTNIFVPLPPTGEIELIIRYPDKKCAEIDGLKAKLVKKRETLKELRQAIISEVVTGKRKVV